MPNEWISYEKEAEALARLPKQTISLLLELIVNGLFDLNIFEAVSSFEDIRGKTESPIEEAFYSSWMILSTSKAKEFESILCECPLTISPQAKIDGTKYRADFIIERIDDGDYKPLIIECDGYEYHSSKSQFEKDRKRDYELKMKGYEVIHFSGAEINRDVFDCCLRAAKLFKEINKKDGDVSGE